MKYNNYNLYKFKMSASYLAPKGRKPTIITERDESESNDQMSDAQIRDSEVDRQIIDNDDCAYPNREDFD